MANKITLTNLNPINGFAAPLSRYINSTIIYYGNKNITTYKTYVRIPIPTTSSDKFGIISGGMEYRPDLVSMQAYGTTDFWWKIMEANNMIDILEFKSGVSIRIPGNIY